MARFRALDPAKIIETLERLERRIGELFPESGLKKLCREVTDTARSATLNVAAIARPAHGFRVAEGAILLLGLCVLGFIAANLNVRRDVDNVFTVLQGIDSGFNIIVLVGAGVLSVIRFEQIAKRTRALVDLHELRSLIHIIDMHQLTKNPSPVATPAAAPPGIPANSLSPFELSRYLDYCSEMLSLTAKVAALYAQSSRDAVVISTAHQGACKST